MDEFISQLRTYGLFSWKIQENYTELTNRIVLTFNAGQLFYDVCLMREFILPHSFVKSCNFVFNGLIIEYVPSQTQWACISYTQGNKNE